MVVRFPWTWRTALPYFFAGLGGLLLLISHLYNIVFLIWITLVLIAVGLLSDHLYQKDLDRKAVDKIKDY